jgi:hypothetical protein
MNVAKNAPTHCYIDESIHETLGFVALAYVFAAEDLNDSVAAALAASGIDPEREEFKSGARMVDNLRMRTARDALLDVINKRTAVAVVFAPRHPFFLPPLGKQCLQALQSVLIRNAIQPHGLEIHIDQGIFASPREAEQLVALFRFLRPATFRTMEVSNRCRRIQLADLLAHTFAQIVREATTDTPKLIDVGGPDTGYAEGTQMPLSTWLLMGIRYVILARRMVSEGEDFDPASDPVILGPNDDPVRYGQNPESFGWGIQVAPEASETLRLAVRRSLERIYLGCMH